MGERCAHGKLIPVVRTVCDCCHQGDPCWSSLSLVKVERPGLLPVPVFVVRVTTGFQDPRVPVHRRTLEENFLDKHKGTKKKRKVLIEYKARPHRWCLCLKKKVPHVQLLFTMMTMKSMRSKEAWSFLKDLTKEREDEIRKVEGDFLGVLKLLEQVQVSDSYWDRVKKLDSCFLTVRHVPVACVFAAIALAPVSGKMTLMASGNAKVSQKKKLQEKTPEIEVAVPIISISEPGIGHALRLGKQEELPFSAPVMLLGVDPHTVHMKIVINDTDVDDVGDLSQSRTDTDDTDLKSTSAEEAPNKKGSYVDPREATKFVKNRLILQG